MAWDFDLEAQSKLAFDRHEPRQNAFTVLALKTALCPQLLDRLGKSPDLDRQRHRPAVRYTALAAGAGSRSAVREA
jgi:hypothetical protein